MTDFDRGLELLNHHLHDRLGTEDHPNIIKNLFEIDQHFEDKKAELQISKRRWNIARKISGALTIAATLGELTAVCVDQLLITSERNDIYWVKISFLISIAITGIFFATVTGIFHYIFGRRYEELNKYMSEISPDDKATIMKIQTVISSIGMLDKHKNDPNIPLDQTIQRCFHCINTLPETPIKDKSLPDKADLVSVVIGTLPERHPIKQKVKEIEGALESESSGSTSAPAGAVVEPTSLAHGFKDIGQRSFPMLAQGIQHQSAKVRYHWSELTNMLGGVHVPSLVSGGRTLVNPLRQNPYANTVIDLEVD